jgi:hypothetical protein
VPPRSRSCALRVITLWRSISPSVVQRQAPHTRRGRPPSWSPPPLQCRQQGLARQYLHLLAALLRVSQKWSLPAATGAVLDVAAGRPNDS